MSEHTGKRKEMIVELMKQLKEGNHSNTDKENYKLWVQTWIIPKIEQLIPELRKKKEAQK